MSPRKSSKSQSTVTFGIAAALLLLLPACSSLISAGGNASGEVGDEITAGTSDNPFPEGNDTPASNDDDPIPTVTPGTCGDNVVEGEEICDGLDLNGTICQDLNFSSGFLACKDDCSGFETKDCEIAPGGICNHDGFCTFGETCSGCSDCACNNPNAPYCSDHGFCVECLSDDMCGTGEVCDRGFCQANVAFSSPPESEPIRILFIGNSFTSGVPNLFSELAVAGGWPAPIVKTNVVGGKDLQYHRESAACLSIINEGNLDYVVLQEFSRLPTDTAPNNNPQSFLTNVVWFYDQIKSANPQAKIILYQTWGYHEDHSIYTSAGNTNPYYDLKDPRAFFGELRHYYNHAAYDEVFDNATFSTKTDIEVASSGDAWEWHLNQPNPVRIHSTTDDYHPNSNGKYLNALMIYQTVYQNSVMGLPESSSVSAEDAMRLQQAVDQVTGD